MVSNTIDVIGRISILKEQNFSSLEVDVFVEIFPEEKKTKCVENDHNKLETTRKVKKRNMKAMKLKVSRNT